MLEICSISFDYHDKPLLYDIQFCVKPGSLLHLRGGNGVGKTTLLKLLAGLLMPMQGHICWQGTSIYENLASYQRKLCYVGHKLGLSNQLTVQENCFLSLHWQQPIDYFTKLVEHFSLHDVLDKPCAQLSAGQLRRVALLRLSMSKASIWLLDEPLIALDSSTLKLLSACFKQHLADGGLIIMTSHQALPADITNYQEYHLC